MADRFPSLEDFDSGGKPSNAQIPLLTSNLRDLQFRQISRIF
jgi:hypothetical protein